jgi:hypothetical protein
VDSHHLLLDAREVDRCDHIGRVGTADNYRRGAVDHRVPDPPGALIALVSRPEHAAAYAICECLQALIDSHPGSPLLYASVARENGLVPLWAPAMPARPRLAGTAKTLAFDLYAHEAAESTFV